MGGNLNQATIEHCIQLLEDRHKFLSQAKPKDSEYVQAIQDDINVLKELLGK